MSILFIFIKGEEIPQGAIREVFEETGIESSFISLLGFRHTHDNLHGR